MPDEMNYMDPNKKMMGAADAAFQESMANLPGETGTSEKSVELPADHAEMTLKDLWAQPELDADLKMRIVRFLGTTKMASEAPPSEAPTSGALETEKNPFAGQE